MKICKKVLFAAVILCAAALTAYVYMYAYFLPKRYRESVLLSACEDKILVYAVIRAESGFVESAVSGKGAVGLMQIKPSTAEYIRLKYSLPEGDLKDGEYNILIGGTYLKYLSERFSDFTAVVAAYNAGEGKVKGWLNDKTYSPDGVALSSTPYAETNGYVARVKKFYKFYKFWAKNT